LLFLTTFFFNFEKIEKFELIPLALSIKSRLVDFNLKNSVAGSRATVACEPRQVRKEAAAAMSTMCCGKPGHQIYKE